MSAETERTFPVLKQMSCAEMPRFVPWSFAETFRVQAEYNHSQTLERLAERGGLAPEEMYMAVHGRPASDVDAEQLPWRRLQAARGDARHLRSYVHVTEAEAIAWLVEAVRKHEKSR